MPSGFKRNTFNVSPASQGAANIINILTGNSDPTGALRQKGMLQGAQLANTFSRSRNLGLKNEKLGAENADAEFMRNLFKKGSLEHQGVIDPRFNNRQLGLGNAADNKETAIARKGLRDSNAKISVGGEDLFVADLLGTGTGADAFNLAKINPHLAEKLQKLGIDSSRNNMLNDLTEEQIGTQVASQGEIGSREDLNIAKLRGAKADSLKKGSEARVQAAYEELDIAIKVNDEKKSAVALEKLKQELKIKRADAKKKGSEARVQAATEDFEISIKSNNSKKSKEALEKMKTELSIKKKDLEQIEAEMKGFKGRLKLKDRNDRLEGLKTEAEIYKLVQQTKDTSGLTDFQKAKFFMDTMESLREANIFAGEESRLTEDQMIQQARLVVNDLSQNGVLKKAADSIEKDPDFEIDSLMSDGALGLLLKMAGDRGGSSAQESGIEETLGIGALQDISSQSVPGPEEGIINELTAQQPAPIDATNPQAVAPPAEPTIVEKENPAINPVAVQTQDTKFGASPHLDNVFATKGVDGLMKLAELLNKRGDPKSMAGLKVLIAYMRNKRVGGQ